MRKIILVAVAIALALSGCSSAPVKSDVVVKYEYIVRKAPDELFVLPTYPSAVDLTTATQADIADWLLKSESRTQELERKLLELKKLQNAPVVSDVK